MKKILSVFSVLILLIPVLFNSLNSSVLAKKAFIQSEKSALMALGSKTQGNQSVISWFRGLFIRVTENGGNRGQSGQNFCSIFPDKELTSLLTTINLKPTFIWLTKPGNKVTKIEVIELKAKNKVIWSHELTASEQAWQMLSYQGKPLEYEGKYKVSYTLNENDKQKRIDIQFDVTSQKQQQEIENQLSQIEKNNSNLSAEKLAQQKADYLTEQGLAADAIQQAFLLKTPSQEWQKGLIQLRQDFCSDSNAGNLSSL